ncbi:Receptor-like protein 9DC3 isoform A [Glycine soja]|uniref:Receptor-like protein 9DC3 isoform A n=2 Tax=Glycine soja TaxID=3848 RepID=A0A445H020_GLYSO|nr:Receptor-like protein 9DC3 isoform A [Glycine soja]
MISLDTAQDLVSSMNPQDTLVVCRGRSRQTFLSFEGQRRNYKWVKSPITCFALLHFKASFPFNTTYYYNAYECPVTNLKTTTWENGTDCCSWLGVTCHPISGHVTGLDLSCSGLYGEIHPNSTLFHLSHLQSLNLANNDFYPSPLSSLFCGFVSLTHLNLSNTYFRGEIPSQISHLSKLQSLDLSLPLNSQFLLKWRESTWKRLLQNATVLRELVLNRTDLSSTSMRPLNLSSSLITLSLRGTGLKGTLADGILCLPNLQHLYLSDNFDLHGQLPNLSCSTTSVSVLQISSNEFQGPIPPSFSNLVHLTFLDLSFNKLNGSIPPLLLALPRLTFLYLRDNYLTGQIPNVFHQSNIFEVLDLTHNNIQVSNFVLQQATRQYSRINFQSCQPYLCLSSNNFSGPVNLSLFSNFQNLKGLYLSQLSQLSLNFESRANYSFSSLLQLDLSSMSLTEFPKLSGKVPILKILYLSNNKLKGRVPTWLHKMDSLSALSLSHNMLTTPMDQFSRNYQLTILDLSFNLLTGSISSSICNASSMESLFLPHNKLTGIIPQCLVNLPYLQVLDLQMNKLYGTLPSTFSRNNRLSTLNLNDNQLEGILPESLSNCTLLEVLNLGNNQIEDTFPHWLQKLPYLKVLVLRANKFHGLIASFKTNHGFPSLIVFDISSNDFSGPIPKAYIQNFEAM